MACDVDTSVNTCVCVCAQGGIVYVNYGRREDFDELRSLAVSLNASIAIARVGGGVSFAEKVWNAQEAGHVGVLIYPDPADVPQDPRRLGLHSNAVISEHVRHVWFTCNFPSLSVVFIVAVCHYRCIWDQVTRSHLDFPPLTTPSSHPPNPLACQSFQLSQSVRMLLPNC